MSDYAEKLRSIATPRKLGQSERRVQTAEGATVIETEHWDGRQDATLRPATVRFGATTHKTGKKKGETAEIRQMSRKEGRERYGNE